MAVLSFPDVKWQVFVLHHVLNLFSHGEGKKDEKVHKKNRPENWDIKHRKQGHNNGDESGCGPVKPEFELG